MDMISHDVFLHVYRQLLYATANEQGNTDIGFDRGIWQVQEGYKTKVREDALKRLDLESWPSHRADETYILDHVYKAVLVAMPDNSREQNLVEYVNYHEFDRKVRKSFVSRKKYATILFDIFFGDNDAENFDSLSEILRSKNVYDQIAIASYIFFLKDCNKYVTARRDGMSRCLEKILGHPTSCLTVCNWKNYEYYLGIVQQTQTFLSAFYSNVSMLDAQSFLWMLYKINQTTPESDLSVSQTTEQSKTIDSYQTVCYEPADSASSNYQSDYIEGNKHIVYSSGYERNPAVRHDFLLTQVKPYRCAVCGFCFEKKYGPIGKDFIEVHHTKPISEGLRKTDLEKDLVLLCSNCHSMIHRGTDHMLTVNELRSLIARDADTEL